MTPMENPGGEEKNDTPIKRKMYNEKMISYTLLLKEKLKWKELT